MLRARRPAKVVAGVQGVSLSDVQQNPLELEKIALERSKLRTERQKLVIEVLLKRRELADRGTKTWRELFANPLTLAIVGGVLTVLTTLVTSTFTAYQNREAEDRRAAIAQRSATQALQAELIKKFVEAPKTETVRENLRFLVDAGLLPDYAASITGYLKDNPNSAPAVNSLVGGIVGSQDQRLMLSELASSAREKFQGVGIVRQGSQTMCAAVMIAPKIMATADYCVQVQSPLSPSTAPVLTFQPAPIGGAGNQPAAVEIDLARMIILKKSDPNAPSVALAPLKSADVSLPYLPLDSAPAPISTQLEAAFFAADKNNWVYSSGPDCRIVAVEPQIVRHLCDTGAGASGAPLLGPSGHVVAIHIGLGPGSKRAFRADAILSDPDVIGRFGNLPKAATNQSRP